MGATNSTTNLQLPQFIGTDKPSWLGDFNGAMLKVDNFAGTATSDIGTVTTTANAAKSTAEAAEAAVGALETTVTQHTTEISDVMGDIASIEADITEINDKINSATTSKILYSNTIQYWRNAAWVGDADALIVGDTNRAIFAFNTKANTYGGTGISSTDGQYVVALKIYGNPLNLPANGSVLSGTSNTLNVYMCQPVMYTSNTTTGFVQIAVFYVASTNNTYVAAPKSASTSTFTFSNTFTFTNKIPTIANVFFPASS